MSIILWLHAAIKFYVAATALKDHDGRKASARWSILLLRRLKGSEDCWVKGTRVLFENRGRLHRFFHADFVTTDDGTRCHIA